MQNLIHNNELLEKIVNESNKYAVYSDLSSPLNLTWNELKQFFGILYLISLVKMLSTRLYWSPDFNYNKVVSIVTVRGFEKFLHFNDNLTQVL